MEKLNDYKNIQEAGVLKTTMADGSVDFKLSNGVFHKSKGPARISADGLLEYFYEGKRHREDGPAVDYVGKTENYPDFKPEYWLKGFQHTLDSYLKAGGKIKEDKIEATNHMSVPSFKRKP